MSFMNNPFVKLFVLVLTQKELPRHLSVESLFLRQSSGGKSNELRHDLVPAPLVPSSEAPPPANREADLKLWEILVLLVSILFNRSVTVVILLAYF